MGFTEYLDIAYVTTVTIMILASIIAVKKFFVNKTVKQTEEKNIYVVDSVEKCDEVCKLLMKNLSLQALGFDAEWVTNKNKRQPIALLQISTLNHCGLFRLNILKSIPDSLQKILENENIIKVGVVPESDARYIIKDYGVVTRSTLDLRHLFKFSSGLSDLALKVLNKNISKTFEVRCSDWGQIALSEKQMNYAAQDAFIAFELYKFYCDNNDDVLLRSIIDTNINQIYSKKINTSTKPVKTIKTHPVQVKERPICRLISSDNTMLSWVLKRRGLWYVQMNQGEVVCEEPFTVRLLFETKYKPNEDERLYEKEEILPICVVCGSTRELLRHHIVPKVLKVHYPPAEKCHYSHDIQYVCFNCKTRGDSQHSPCLIEYLKKYINYHEDQTFEKLRGAQGRARALLKFENVMPAGKAEEMKAFILDNTDVTVINKENLEEILKLSFITETNRMSSAIVNYFMSENRSIFELTKICRQYFISNFKPKHLPKYWSVDYKNV